MASIGTRVRKALGPLEGAVIHRYRDWFVNLDELARGIARMGDFRRILEIGAGDGLLCQHLHQQLPQADILGIDISSTPGEMFEGDHERVRFEQIDAAELLDREEPFDLVVIADVLHHVPPAQRGELLAVAGSLVAPGGVLVMKDWERTPGVAQAVTYTSDRWVSGDRGVSFMTLDEQVGLLESALPGHRIVAEYRVSPRRNNVVFAVRSA